MLASLFFSMQLISASGLGPFYPDPYVGFGLGVFPNRRYSANETGELSAPLARDSYTVFGVPLRLFAIPESEWRFWDYVVTPEVAFSASIIQFNLTAGPEFEQKMGYRSRLSGILWSLQAGVHYANLVAPDHPIGADGLELASNETDSLAFLVSPSFGPRFVITDKLAFRVLFNPKIILGHISQRTFATNQYNWLGATMNFNFQFEISSWLRDL